MNAPDVKALRVNPDWATLPLFERKGWRRLAIGEVAECVNERVEPSEAADEIYVGLDDLEPGNLHIRIWGKGSDVIGTKLRFRKGDIIFGRRRAYQRKLAVAEFDGICSAHAMVVRARPEVVLPEFLPFLMMSDRFMKRAVDISVGSLSPTINWSTLKLEEFDLPPLEQQRRIAVLLWAIDSLEQAELLATHTVRGHLRATIEATLDEMFLGTCEPLVNLWPRSPDSGCSAPPSSVDTGHHVLSLTALSEDGYVPGNLKLVEPTAPMRAARLATGDILISRSNTQELVGLVGIFEENRDDVSFPDTMMRLHIDERRVMKRFLEIVLLSARGRRHMMRSAAGTSGSMKKINRQTLGQCLVPIPKLGAQRSLLERTREMRETAAHCESALASTRILKLAMTNEVIG